MTYFVYIGYRQRSELGRLVLNTCISAELSQTAIRELSSLNAGAIDLRYRM